jgi:hypothetical protein
MFKMGDTIRCVQTNEQYRVYAGVLYTVREMHGEWMNLTHTNLPYHVSYFERVNQMNPDKIEINGKAKPKTKGKTPANTYYVRNRHERGATCAQALQIVGSCVVNVGGSPKVVHKTFDEARNEANRLAELTPDAEFQVLAVAYTVKKVPVYTTEAQEYTL